MAGSGPGQWRGRRWQVQGWRRRGVGDSRSRRKPTLYKSRVVFSKLIHAARVRSGSLGPNHGPFTAKLSSHHVHSTLQVIPPTSPLSHLSLSPPSAPVPPAPVPPPPVPPAPVPPALVSPALVSPALVLLFLLMQNTWGDYFFWAVRSVM